MRSSGRSTAAPSWPPCRRTRRCPPPGWPSSTTCRRPTWPRRSRRWPTAGIVESRPGPLGGYRLARPPADISRARHRAGRRRRRHRRSGAARSASAARRPAPGSPRLPPAVRHRPGDVAGRGRLAGRAGGRDGRRHRHRALRNGARRAAGARGRVDPGSRRTTKEQDMKVFVAGATGVLGRATVPRLVAAGHEVRGAARSPEKADQLRAQGAEPVTVDLFDPASVRAAVDGCQGVVHMATQHPAAHQGLEGRRLGHQRPPPPRGHPRPRRRLPRRRRGGAGEGDGVVLLRRRRRPSGSTRTGPSSASPSARRRSTPRTPRSPSPATVAGAWCCASASSTPTTPVPSRRA